jgi:hypothetical protein
MPKVMTNQAPTLRQFLFSTESECTVLWSRPTETLLHDMSNLETARWPWTSLPLSKDLLSPGSTLISQHASRASRGCPRHRKKSRIQCTKTGQKLSAIHIILIRMHQGDLLPVLPPSFPDPDLSWLLPRMPQVMGFWCLNMLGKPPHPLVDQEAYGCQTKVSPPTGKGRIEGLWNLTNESPSILYQS